MTVDTGIGSVDLCEIVSANRAEQSIIILHVASAARCSSFFRIIGIAEKVRP